MRIVVFVGSPVEADEKEVSCYQLVFVFGNFAIFLGT